MYVWVREKCILWCCFGVKVLYLRLIIVLFSGYELKSFINF